MTELKQLIASLIRGKQTFEVVSQALDQFLGATPNGAPHAARLLQAARKSGLPHHVYVALNGQVGTHVRGRADPNTTEFADDSGTAAVTVDDRRRDAGPELTVFSNDADATRKNVVTANFAKTLVLERPPELGTGSSARGAKMHGGETTADVSRSENTVIANGAITRDRTVLLNDSEDSFDILGATAMSAAEAIAEAPTGASWPTAAGQRLSSQATGPIAGIDREFHHGDLLRGRFELISKLGEGGMGAVWKGKDKLKEEARDRNPFVAIKLLQGDFKAHPEAFIALQRETAKQQRLAHPNIATVYDFDRDDATGTVFMTMEVLEGQPLDSFIRKLPADGLPEEEAMPLVQELCAGLAYAHQASLVHSDLKPGNCFYTKEGNIKLLDFGIARASKTKGDAEGETTLFDPGQLGALTPTYATIEMFEGGDPDPRDDIYALAIMTYQLLTGKHPYGKKSAPKAKDLGLTVEPIAKLNKRQNKGLARGLAFVREERAESVEVFLESITRKKSRAGLWAGAAVAAAIVIGVLAYGPIQNHIDTGKREAIITLIQQAGAHNIRDGLEQARALGEQQLALVLDDERVIAAAAGLFSANEGNNVESGLALLATYPEEWQRRVMEVDEVRESIFAHYGRHIQSVFSPTDGRFDYPAAERDLKRLEALYADSKQAFQLRSQLEENKTATLLSLGNQYKNLKAAGKLIPSKDEDDIADVLVAVRAIDPDYFMLKDDDLPYRFAEEATKAIKIDRDYQRAEALLAASVAYAPNDGALKSLRYDLAQILTRIENEKRIAILESRLSLAEPELKTLSDYRRVREELAKLADLSAQSRVLLRIQTQLKSAFDNDFSGLTTTSKWQQAEDLLFDFAPVLSIAELTRHRAALSAAQQRSGIAPDQGARKARIDERVALVKELLTTPDFSIDWESRLKVPYKELLALQPLGSAELEQVRTDTARLLLGAALDAREQHNYNQAREFVAKGLEFYPGLKSFGDELTAIETAERQFLADRADEERLAKVGTFKKEFAEHVHSNDVQAANAALQEIAALGVNADDEFLSATAPSLLAGAYQRLSKLAADGDDFVNAAELAQQGLKLDPELQALSEALAGYQSEVKKRERETALIALFNTTKPIDVAAVQQSLDALKANIPERFDALLARLSDTRATRLRKYARTKDVDIAALAARAREFAALFPNSGSVLIDELADAVETGLRRVNVRSSKALAGIDKPLAAFAQLAPQRHATLSTDLAARVFSTVQALEPADKAAAAALLRTAKAIFPNARNLASLNIAAPLRALSTGLAQLQRGQLAAAAKSLAAAKATDAAHPDISPFETQLGNRRKQADSAYAQHVAKARDPLGYKAKGEVKELFKQAASLCSDCGYKEKQTHKPVAGLCHEGLVGFGAKRAGQCWDQLGRNKGPVMVVIPSGGGSRKPFAIGKYEVSQRDLNVFCKASNLCKVVLGSNSRLPATGVAAQLAERYAQWLSETASRALKQKVTYRLPTAAEWEHAANAGGAQPEREFNCRVTSGGDIIAGHDLVDARSGQQNGWGLANYIGNAWELVRNSGGFAVRGGDFAVPLTKCDVSTSKPHSGSADASTGFRLLRELG